MRLKIVLQSPHNISNPLPANYQLQMADALSNLFNNPSSALLQRLHQDNYLDPTETAFDAFTFSPLQPNGNNQYSFILSLCIDDAFEYLLKSIFYQQTITLTTPNNTETHLLVWTINRLPDPSWQINDPATLKFRCISPFYLHKKDKSNDLVQPRQRGFKTKLFGNLVDKFLHLRHLPHNMPLETSPAQSPATAYNPYPIEQMPSSMPQWQSVQPARQHISQKQDWLQCVLPSNTIYSFKLLTEPKTTFAPLNNPQNPSTPMLYQYDFELTAPAQLLRIGYEAGFGENTTMGFGFVEMLDNNAS